jgi:hypothetical protein
MNKTNKKPFSSIYLLSNFILFAVSWNYSPLPPSVCFVVCTIFRKQCLFARAIVNKQVLKVKTRISQKRLCWHAANKQHCMEKLRVCIICTEISTQQTRTSMQHSCFTQFIALSHFHSTAQCSTVVIPRNTVAFPACSRGGPCINIGHGRNILRAFLYFCSMPFRLWLFCTTAFVGWKLKLYTFKLVKRQLNVFEANVQYTRVKGLYNANH